MKLTSGPSRRKAPIRAMTDKLDHLVATGFTAIELMPLADFPGRRNWGYDGVLWYAPDSSYGRPEDLKALIDAAHLRGLMVFSMSGLQSLWPGRKLPRPLRADVLLDLPDPVGQRNRLSRAGGPAVCYRQCASLAEELSVRWPAARRRSCRLPRSETEHSHRSQPSLWASSRRQVTARSILFWRMTTIAPLSLDPATNPPRGKYRAQWNDDYHHAWHVLLTQEGAGYYGDYPTPVPPSHARCGPDSLIKARRLLIVMALCVVRLAATSHRSHSSTFCRTMIRSATARSAIALDVSANPSRR